MSQGNQYGKDAVDDQQAESICDVIRDIKAAEAAARVNAQGGLSIGVKAALAGQIAQCIGEVPQGAERLADVITSLD